MAHINTRGSEWRIWDLHFHTPASYDVSDSITVDNIIDAWLKHKVMAVAITDHHVIDVEQFKLLSEKAIKHGITVFPGIEFLSDARGSDPVHFIGIFPENCNVQFVWEQIKNKTDISKHYSENVAVNSIYCRLDETAKLVHKLGGIVTIHAGQKSNSIECITNSLPHAMAQKVDISSHVDIFEIGKAVDAGGYQKHVFPAIGKALPMIMCSDCHNANEYSFKEYLWVKADLNFDGLKQIINEPFERVFIGDKPPLLDNVDGRGGKYIDTVSIKPVVGETGIGWFDVDEFPLNPSLVAIIGNKGSGKSALADIIGLVGNSERTDFSFLKPDKFDKLKIGNRFEASIKWLDATITTKLLNDREENDDVQKVQFLSQNTIEKICGSINDESFEDEIHKAIFSHLSYAEREGCDSLSDLIKSKTARIEDRIQQIVNEILKTNKKILSFEEIVSTEYLNKINNLITNKEKEIRELNNNKPKDVPEPTKLDQSSEMVQVRKDLLRVGEEGEKLKQVIDESNKKLSLLNKKLTALSNIRGALLIIDESIKGEFNKVADSFELLGINATEIFEYEIKGKKLDDLFKQISEEKAKLEKDLNPEVEGSSESKINKLRNEYNKLKDKLGENERKYQDFLKAKKKWENDLFKLLGHDLDPMPETLNYYKQKLLDIEHVKKTLPMLLEDRKKLVMQIHTNKNELKNELEKLFKPVSNFLKNNTITSKSDFNMEFSVSIEDVGFQEQFLGYINKGYTGSFYGVEESNLLVQNAILFTDFNDFNGTIAFLDTINNLLYSNHRDNNKPKMRIKDQLKSGFESVELLNFMFSLKYLVPKYKLRLDGKELTELSPGERGQMLLIFYLVVDKSDIPIIIDQPEDNLDNQSVYGVLKPCIKEARNRRQVIIVTHNPNLAIACDAEQIIVASMDKKNKNIVKYTAGSIESKIINEHSLNILEGTRAAFDKRDSKYFA